MSKINFNIILQLRLDILRFLFVFLCFPSKILDYNSISATCVTNNNILSYMSKNRMFYFFMPASCYYIEDFDQTANIFTIFTHWAMIQNFQTYDFLLLLKYVTRIHFCGQNINLQLLSNVTSLLRIHRRQSPATGIRKWISVTFTS
jgi:hypothetical protein